MMPVQMFGAFLDVIFPVFGVEQKFVIIVSELPHAHSTLLDMFHRLCFNDTLGLFHRLIIYQRDHISQPWSCRHDFTQGKI